MVCGLEVLKIGSRALRKGFVSRSAPIPYGEDISPEQREKKVHSAGFRNAVIAERGLSIIPTKQNT